MNGEKTESPFRAFYRKSGALGAVYALVRYGLTLACGLMVSNLLECAMDSSWQDMYRGSVYLAVTLVAAAAVQYGLTLVLSRWRLRDTQSFRAYLYAQVIDGGLKLENPGQMQVRMTRDVQTLSAFYQETRPSAVCALAVMAVSTLLIWRIHWGIALIFFAMNFIQLIPVVVYEKWAREIYDQTHTDEETYCNWMVEGSRGIRTLKAFGMENWFMERYRKLNREIVNSGVRAEKTGTVENVVFAAIDSLLNYGSYLIIGGFILPGSLPLERAPVLIVLAGYLFSSISSVYDLRLQQFEAEEAFDRLKCTPVPQESRNTGHMLAVENLSKAFDGKTVLHGVSLTVDAGEKLILRGSNGSGKSTLLRILTGLETADSGRFAWGVSGEERGIALQEEPDLPVTGLELLDAMAASGSIRREAALTNAKNLGIGEMLEKELNQLSGGERKKFYLAAALAHRGQMLLLDEPTNHMDKESVAYLQQVLENYPGTLLVITHDDRLNLTGSRILTLEGGALV